MSLEILSKRSMVSCAWKGLKKKNQLTLNSLPIVFFAVSSLILIYGFVLLVCLGGTNKGFAIGVICFNLCWFCVIYPQMQIITFRDMKFRSLIFYVIISGILSIISVILLPNLAGPSLQQGYESQLILLMVGIEIVTKQISDFASDIVNYMVEESSSRSWKEYAKFKVAWCLIHIILSFVESILLFAMVLPVSISLLDLSEWQKVVIFGVAFPLFRYLCGKILINAAYKAHELGGLDKMKVIFTVKIAVALCFGSTPLFSMLSNSPDILFFSLQYIPHAFVSKLSWMINIPFVDKRIKIIKLKDNYIFCCCRKRNVKPQGEKHEVDESSLTKAIRRISMDVIKIVTNDDKLLDNNKLPKVLNHSLDSSNKEKEEENKRKLKEIKNSNYVMIVEAVSILADKLAVIAYVMSLFNLLFFRSDSPDGINIERLIQALVCTFGVIFIFDQISAIIGFAMLEYQGIELDTDLGLGDNNPLNAIRTLNSGNRWKALGDLMYMSSFSANVLLTIVFAQTVKLF